MARLTDCPAEILVEIFRNLVLPMQNERDGYQRPCATPTTFDTLSCRTALARLMRTCRKLHDVAGCMLYSGYYNIGHPSEALVFLKALDQNADGLYGPSNVPPEDSRAQLVRHADLHSNLHLDRPIEVDWSPKQEDLTVEPWINMLAGSLGIYFPDGWNECRVGTGKRDHVLEHINQLFIRYLPKLTTLDVSLCYNWKFALLQNWAVRQQNGYTGLLPKLRHLKIQLWSVESRSFECHKIILLAASHLSTLTVHDSYSYTIPPGCQLLNLRSLRFVFCSMDRKSMKNVLLATPNVTHFEYRVVLSGAITPKKPLVTPQMLCNLLRNEYDLADPPPPHDVRRPKLKLPDLHLQLRSLIIDFHSSEDKVQWNENETVASLRDFIELRHLAIDAGSYISQARSQNGLVINKLSELIPENLETLKITRIGQYCFEGLLRTSLSCIAAQKRKGRFRGLRRIELLDCDLDNYRQQRDLNGLRTIFDWPGAPVLCVNGRVERRLKGLESSLSEPSY